MTEYLIAFQGEWVPDQPEAEFRAAGERVRALRAEMQQAGVLVFLGGLEEDGEVWGATAAGLVTDGPYAETKEHLGGFTIVDVETDEEAQAWLAKVAVACGWPQQLHRFQSPGRRPD